MLRRCGFKAARELECGYVYAGRLMAGGDDIEAVLEIRRDSLGCGRYAAILYDQFADEGEEYIGFSPREARAVEVRIREMERERKKTIRKERRAEAKTLRIIRMISRRAAKER